MKENQHIHESVVFSYLPCKTEEGEWVIWDYVKKTVDDRSLVYLGLDSEVTYQKHMKVRTMRVKKGKHDMRPKRFPWIEWPSIHYSRKRNHTMEIEVEFTEKSRYSIGKDQNDWLKVAGITEELTTNNINAGMLAVRYHPGIDMFELGLYVNSEGKKLFPTTHVIWCSIDQPIRARLNLFEGLYTIQMWRKGQEDTTKVLGMRGNGRSDNPKLVRNIGSWFGGSEVAPHPVEWKKGAKWK